MSLYILTTIDKATVVEFRTASLMDPGELETIGRELEHLVVEQDRRKIILDFTNVQFISSQAIGIVISMHKKLGELRNSRLLLCGINAKLLQLLQITRLDKLLTVKPTQKEAVTTINSRI